MDLDEALHRRVLRLALLLTGDPRRAADALAAIIATDPDLQRLTESRLDRLVVQNARADIPSPSTGDLPDPIAVEQVLQLPDRARRLWDAALELPEQPREAWILRDLEQMDDIPAARAMDCSRTAIENVHRPHAHEHLTAALADNYTPALAELRTAFDTLEPEHMLASARRARQHALRRRRITTILLLALLFACFAILAYVIFDLLAWQTDHQIDPADFTNPSEFQPGPMNAPGTFPQQPPPAP